VRQGTTGKKLFAGERLEEIKGIYPILKWALSQKAKQAKPARKSKSEKKPFA